MIIVIVLFFIAVSAFLSVILNYAASLVSRSITAVSVVTRTKGMTTEERKSFDPVRNTDEKMVESAYTATLVSYGVRVVLSIVAVLFAFVLRDTADFFPSASQELRTTALITFLVTFALLFTSFAARSVGDYLDVTKKRETTA